MQRHMVQGMSGIKGARQETVILPGIFRDGLGRENQDWTGEAGRR